MVRCGALRGRVVRVVAVGADVVAQRELVAVAWLVFVVVPGAREPVYLTHSGKSHGLFHGKVVVAVETQNVGVGLVSRFRP